MKLRSPEEIIDALVAKYRIEKDNLIDLKRLFVAASVVRWVFSTTQKTEEILQYLLQVEKHLEGQIELYWEEGIIKVGRSKRGKQ